MSVDKILYFVPIKLNFFGASAVCCVSGFVCMARYQSKILYPFRTYQFPADHPVFTESNGRYFLRMDRCLLWRDGADDRYLGLSCGEPEGIPVAHNQPG